MLYAPEAEEHLRSLFVDDAPNDEEGDPLLDPWFAAFVHAALTGLASADARAARSQITADGEETAQRWLVDAVVEGQIPTTKRMPRGSTLGSWAQRLQREERLRVFDLVCSYLEE